MCTHAKLPSMILSANEGLSIAVRPVQAKRILLENQRVAKDARLEAGLNQKAAYAYRGPGVRFSMLYLLCLHSCMFETD